MTMAEHSPFGTEHGDYLATLDDAERDAVAIAGRAWEIAEYIEEVRERDSDIPCYFPLKPEDAPIQARLAEYLHELGYDAEIIPRKSVPGALVHVGPRRRGATSHRRPRRLERYG